MKLREEASASFTSKAKRLKIRRSLGPCVLLFLFAVNSVWAVDPHTLISQYGHTAWRIQDGYFGGQLTAVAQTADGYLWVGTRAGLLHFDGVRFVPWTPPAGQQLPSLRIRSLLGARDGSLWIGTDSGVSHWVNQKLINLNLQGTIGSIIEDRIGAIWFIDYHNGDTSLCKVIETATQCYGRADGIPDQASGSLAWDAIGNLWIGYEHGVVRWQRGSFTAYNASALKSIEGVDGVEAVAADPDGSILVGMAMPGHGLGLQQLMQGVWKPYQKPGLDGTTLTVATLFMDREGALWIGTLQQGLYRVHGQKVEHFGSADGLSSDFVREFYEDHEGNLWIVTSRGIDFFHSLRVLTFSRREGLGTEVTSVFTSRDGTVWAGGAESLDAIREDGVSSVRTGDGLPGSQVTALFEDHAGQFWVGVDQTLSIYKNGSFRPIKRSDGSPVGEITAITEDKDHNIWAETFHKSSRRLLRIRDFKIQEEFQAPQIPAARQVLADSDGSLWLGLLNGDLARVENGRPEIFHFERTEDSRLQQVMINPDGSVLGASVFGVIGWKNGKQQILTARNGLPCNGVQGLVTDVRGNLWLHMQCGIVEVADAELQKWWEQSDNNVHPRVFDVYDGAQPGEAPWTPAARSTDGRLWFANGSVLQMIDPAHLAGNAAPPPVHVEEIIADRKSYSPQDGLRIPPLPRDLEIDYTALSFAVPQKVRFRYKLEGHDLAWQEPGTRRQAYYSDLPPGKYRFRVIACNNDGIWNETGATFNFGIAPAWYQTNWFRVLCVISSLFVLWLLYWLRVRKISKAISTRFDERLAERTRMARDFHDTFLQTIQGSKLVADDALDEPSDPIRMRRAMVKLSEWLGQATQEGRAALNSLRTSTAETNDLAQALQRATEDCQVPGSIVVNFTVVGETKRMHPIVRDEIYRIGYEAIRNACAHSSASQLEVELTYGQDLSLRVADNGVGIDPDVADRGKDGHFGLQGMRERAVRIGAKLTLASSSALGTEIKLVVPGGIIFQKTGPVRQTLLTKIRALIWRTNQPSKLD
jgi:ligand-binding sensor domain-containing protein